MCHIPAALSAALFCSFICTVRAIPPNQQARISLYHLPFTYSVGPSRDRSKLGDGLSMLYMPSEFGKAEGMDARVAARGAQGDTSEAVTHRKPLVSLTGLEQVIATTVGGEQRVWPELVGVSYEEARGVLAASGKQPQMVPQGNVVTADYRQDRVRVYVDEEQVVIAVPRIG